MAGKQMQVESRANADALGRYYTRAEISRFLVREMGGLSPRTVLDLGAGDGSLVRAAAARWLAADLITVDIDVAAKRSLSRSLKQNAIERQHNHIRADALDPRVFRLIERHSTSIDTAVCNPPFMVPRWRKGFEAIIEGAGFSASLASIPEMDAALLFLAQNLRLTAPGATLGLILPDSLICAKKYRPFREELLDKHRITKVIRLPRCSFQATDAQAYILVVKKNGRVSKQIQLQQLSPDGCLSREIRINATEAYDRLDFSYHRAKGQFTVPTDSLRKLGVEIFRGRASSAEVKASFQPILHTTDLTPAVCGQWCDFTDFGDKPRVKQNHAAPGDIIVARVGRNLEEKVVGVAYGYPEVSDCLHVVRAPAKLRQRILAYLSSTEGKKALSSLAYGVSAKQLTKVDLENLELPL